MRVGVRGCNDGRFHFLIFSVYGCDAKGALRAARSMGQKLGHSSGVLRSWVGIAIAQSYVEGALVLVAVLVS